MTIPVSIDLSYAFGVRAGASEVFDVLSDVPTSASFFPKVEKLVDLGDKVFRWEMEKIGLTQINLQTIYASRYTSDKEKGTVVWTPVKGIGNAQVAGRWKITDEKTFTRVQLHLQGDLEINLPSLMKMLVAPVVESEFEKMIVQYIDNLIKRFGGEV